MKTTTVRFGDDLWALLENEAATTGTSVSQYIREAALSRAAFWAGTRADAPADLLARWAASSFSPHGPGDAERDAELLIAALTRTRSRATREAAEAVRHESEQAQRRTRELRDS